MWRLSSRIRCSIAGERVRAGTWSRSSRFSEVMLGVTNSTAIPGVVVVSDGLQSVQHCSSIQVETSAPASDSLAVAVCAGDADLERYLSGWELAATRLIDKHELVPTAVALRARCGRGYNEPASPVFGEPPRPWPSAVDEHRTIFSPRKDSS
jgi:hypothetical protein